MHSNHIIIIGGGITGLTTACELLQRNYKVTIIAERYGSQGDRITSQIAGALWEWPAVCGRHTGPLSLDKSKHWWKVLYNKFKEIVANMALSATAVVKMPLPKNFFVKPLLHPFQQETSILTSYTIGC
jgi:D-amino-acid oxidase